MSIRTGGLVLFWATVMSVADAAGALNSDSGGPPPFRMAAIDLQLDLDYKRQWIDGRVILTIENWTDNDAAEVPLLVGRLMTIDSVIADNGQPLSFQQGITVLSDWTLRQVNAARVQLPKPIAPGKTTRITVAYSGHLVGATETGMGYVRDRLDPAFTVLRVEAFAFPEIAGTSNAESRSVPRRDFAFTARITVPDSLIVATGGETVERQVAGARATYVVRSRRPVPFLNLTVAPYRVFSRGSVRAYVLPQDSGRGGELLDVVDRSLSWYRARYGEIARVAEFSIMEIPDGFGSQAHLDAGIMIEAHALQRIQNRRSLYHEIAHLWNPADAEAPSPRWNEGLAMYLQERVAADLDGADLAAAAASTAAWACTRARTSDEVKNTALINYGKADMTGWSYTVGALLFHVLENVVGRARFDRTYRDLYQSRKTTTISVADLAHAFEKADARAQRVFEDWVYTTAWYARLCNESDFPATIAFYSRR